MDSSHLPKDRKNMKPKEMVDYLDRYVIGQADAKRAVANAFKICSSAASVAFGLNSSSSRDLCRVIAISNKSLIIESTSRP
mmetsp:Transcript_14394/g.12026  ORF Transcript_14394/g.12026 Transcript_14394/m.12026 type:complete len:81 (-) Transcript_14394:31-273(-)